MGAIEQLSSSIRRSLGALFACGLLFWMCMASLLPVLPLYIRDNGATAQEIGIVMAAFAVGLLLFRPQMGRLADRRGRKVVLLIGIVAAAIAPLGYFLTQPREILLLVRVFHGLSIAAFTTAYSTLVTDIAPPQSRGEVIGYMTLVTPIGMALGPLLGDWLLHHWGYSLCFLAASAIAAISLIFGLAIQGVPEAQSQPLPVIHPSSSPASTPRQFSPESLQVVSYPSSSGFNSASHNQPFWQILWSDRLRTPTLTLLIVGVAFGILSIFVPLYLRETNLAVTAGTFYTSAATTSFLMRFLAGRNSDRYGRGRFITLGLICYCCAMLLLWLAPRNDLFILAGLLEGIGGGTLLPITIALLADRSQAGERGRIFSLCIAGFDLGVFLAGPLVGGLADWVGYRGVFGIAAGLSMVGLLLFTTLSSKDLAHSLHFSLKGGTDIYAFDKK
ncbi:MFS transporter [Alkalinema pantanalense CENA528]|uniref:MFS transporter n=1 Tax=Alkalinema pantanalense TaxID=1620705 RepID=UPI003D6FA56E